MFKFFPNRYCPGQQDFWQMHVPCWSELDEAPWVHLLLFRTCVTAATPHSSFRHDLWVTLTHWLDLYFPHSEGRQGNTVPQHLSMGRSQPHLTCSRAERLVSNPAAQLSYWIFFSSHSWVNSLVKRAKGHINEMFFDWHMTLRPLTHQPQLLAHSGVWPSLAHGCGYTGKPPSPSHSGDQREGNFLCTAHPWLYPARVTRLCLQEKRTNNYKNRHWERINISAP